MSKNYVTQRVMDRRLRPIGKHIWCMECMKKKPPIYEKAAHLIPLRKGHYDLAPDGLNIDLRVTGICEDCLTKASEFQQKYKTEIDVNNENIVYFELQKE